MAARVIAELPNVTEQYWFSHALIRETLYEELSTTRRVRLHRQPADACRLDGIGHVDRGHRERPPRAVDPCPAGDHREWGFGDADLDLRHRSREGDQQDSNCGSYVADNPGRKAKSIRCP